MKILTIKGTPNQINNLFNALDKFDKDRIPKITEHNPSENLLRCFLKFKKKGGFTMQLRLNGQGDYCIISSAPINLCTVKIEENEYFFGGISESFYDKMVSKYHTEL